MVLSEAAAARDAASSMKAPTVAASSAPRMMQKPSRAKCLVLGALDAATASIVERERRVELIGAGSLGNGTGPSFG